MKKVGYIEIGQLVEGLEIDLMDDTEEFVFDYEQGDIIKALRADKDDILEESSGFKERMGPVNHLFNSMRKSLFNKV